MTQVFIPCINLQFVMDKVLVLGVVYWLGKIDCEAMACTLLRYK